MQYQQGLFLGEALLDSPEEFAKESAVGLVDPSLLIVDPLIVKKKIVLVFVSERELTIVPAQTQKAHCHLLVGHVLEVAGCSVFLGAEPDLLSIGVESFDDVVLLLKEHCVALVFAEAEDGVVKLFPQQDPAGRNLVDGLSELRLDRDDAAGGLAVAVFPSKLVVDAGRLNDQTLGTRRCLPLLGNLLFRSLWTRGKNKNKNKQTAPSFERPGGSRQRAWKGSRE